MDSYGELKKITQAIAAGELGSDSSLLNDEQFPNYCLFQVTHRNDKHIGSMAFDNMLVCVYDCHRRIYSVG